LPERRATDVLRRRHSSLSLRRQSPGARSSQDPCAIGPPAVVASHQQILSDSQRVPDDRALCRIPGRQSVPDDDVQQILLHRRARPVRVRLWPMISSRGCFASHLPGIPGSHRVAVGPGQRKVGGDPGGEQPRSQTRCDSPSPGSFPHKCSAIQRYEHRIDAVGIVLAEPAEGLLLAQSGWGPGIPHMLAAGYQRQDIVHQVQTRKQELIQTSGFLLQLCGFAC
jgi:hypothetical protein